MTAPRRPMPRRDEFAELGELILQAGDGTLDAAGHARLEQWLLADPAARQWYCRYVMLEVDLTWSESDVPRRVDLPRLVPSESPEPIATSGLPGGSQSAGRSAWRWVALLVGALAASLALVYVSRGPSGAGSAPDWRATIVAVSPGVLVTSRGTSTAGAVGNELASGSHIELPTHEAEFALRYADGTEVHFAGAGELNLPERQAAPHGAGKCLEIRRGVLYVSVAPQPLEKPLVVVAPHAHILVRGTQFIVSAVDAGATQIELLAGTVEVVRLRDGRRVSLTAGRWLDVNDARGELNSQPLPARLAAKSDFPAAQGEHLLGVWHNTVTTWHNNRIERREASGMASEQHPVPAEAGQQLLLGTDRNACFVAKATGEVRQFDTATWKLTGTFTIPPFNLAALAPRSDRLATASESLDAGGQPCTDLSVFRTTDFSPEATRRLSGVSGSLRLAWFREQLLVLSGSHPRGVWRVPFDAAQSPEFLETGVNPLALAVCDDAGLLLLSTASGQIVAWSLDQRQQAFTLPAFGLPLHLAVSDDGEFVAAALADGRLRVWQLANRRELAWFAGRRALPEGLAFSPDSRLLAVNWRGGGTRLFDTTAPLALPPIDAPSPSDTIPRPSTAR